MANFTDSEIKMVAGHSSDKGLFTYTCGESVKRRASEVLAGPSTTDERDEDFDSDGTMEYCMSQVEIPDGTVSQSNTNFNFCNCNVTKINLK